MYLRIFSNKINKKNISKAKINDRLNKINLVLVQDFIIFRKVKISLYILYIIFIKYLYFYKKSI